MNFTLYNKYCTVKNIMTFITYKVHIDCQEFQKFVILKRKRHTWSDTMKDFMDIWWSNMVKLWRRDYTQQFNENRRELKAGACRLSRQDSVHRIFKHLTDVFPQIKTLTSEWNKKSRRFYITISKVHIKPGNLISNIFVYSPLST